MSTDQFDMLQKQLGNYLRGDSVKGKISPLPSSPLPDLKAFEAMAVRKSNPAMWMYERLGEYVKDFEKGLDQEHEIGVRLVSFGETITFHVESVGYHGPDIISFDGKNQQGERLQLIQHISQLSFLLIAVKKLGVEPKRIGFTWDQEKKRDSDQPNAGKDP